MFRRAVQAQVPRSVEATGKLTPIQVPYKGMNARSSFSVMGPEYAISLTNVFAEQYGIRSRKGYLEYARGIPGGAVPVSTILSYWSAAGVNKFFAAKGGRLYDVTAGGVGPFVAEVGIVYTTDFWTGANYQNIAGSYLLCTNDSGGYSYYDGTNWATPTMGAGVGQIANVDPATFVHVLTWKKRAWFTKKDSTSAWYLPVEQITGAATEFNFGSQFAHGGYLVMLASWTVDGGDGMNDQLVAVSSNGDVVIYQGNDPSSATDFNRVGSFYCGPLPAGRRCVSQSGGEVYILSQFGLVPLSKLLTQSDLAAQEKQHISYLIDPLIASLMKVYAYSSGWQVFDVPREELQVIGVPVAALSLGVEYFTYKSPTQAWSQMNATTFSYIVNIGAEVYAGTSDGRVVKAFTGQLDNVLIGATSGSPILCQVTPAYNSLGNPGVQNRIVLIRPTFITSASPVLSIKILVDYGPTQAFSVPTLPINAESQWNVALWDLGLWGGLLTPIKKWLGCRGFGFAATPQMDFACVGDTLLTSIDFWTEPAQGGVL